LRLALAALCLIMSLSAMGERISPRMVEYVLIIGEMEGVPRSVTRQLMQEESGGCAEARSKPTKEGYSSVGLFQIYERPDNLSSLVSRHWGQGDFEITNPVHNATVALRYLSALHSRFGNWLQALYYYNHGSLVDVPQSTRDYARRIVNARNPR
jgi:hypothetical protein